MIDRAAQSDCLNKTTDCGDFDLPPKYQHFVSKLKGNGYYDEFFKILPDSLFSIYFVSKKEQAITVRLTMFKIHFLPMQIRNLKELHTLVLRGSDDMDLNSIFCDLHNNCQKLNRLTLSARKCDTLTKLPASIGLLSSLTYLSFGDCVFEDFPLDIKQLKNLSELSLLSKTSDVYVFKKVIRYLPNLKKANLRDGVYEREGEIWIKKTSKVYSDKPSWCNYYIVK